MRVQGLSFAAQLLFLWLLCSYNPMSKVPECAHLCCCASDTNSLVAYVVCKLLYVLLRSAILG